MSINNVSLYFNEFTQKNLNEKLILYFYVIKIFVFVLNFPFFFYIV